MENTFIVNIIHRPEMVPEYAEKVTGHGQAEDIGRKALLTESLDIFKFQQETAHKNGLKTTIQMTYASLFNEEAVSLAKEHHEKYGDEIALSLLGLPCTEFREKYKTKDFCIWMFSMEDKKNIVDDVFGKFHDIFGFYPVSTHGTHCSMVVHGIRGYLQSRTHMHLQQMRLRTAESLLFLIFQEICWHATMEMVLTSVLIHRTFSVE